MIIVDVLVQQPWGNFGDSTGQTVPNVGYQPPT